jgi:hypothetical protein
MMIIHAIRQSENEHEVYHLLTAYMEATRLIEQPFGLGERAEGSPVNCMEVVRQYLEDLFGALQIASTSLDDHARVVIKEALYVFGAALEHLGWLRNEDGMPRSAGRPLGALAGISGDLFDRVGCGNSESSGLRATEPCVSK